MLGNIGNMLEITISIHPFEKLIVWGSKWQKNQPQPKIKNPTKTRWWFQIFVHFHLYFGKWFNHQPEKTCHRETRDSILPSRLAPQHDFHPHDVPQPGHWSVRVDSSTVVPWEQRYGTWSRENIRNLVGGFKYFLFSPLLGEMIQFD